MLCKPQSALQMLVWILWEEFGGSSRYKELYLESDALGSNHTLGTYCVNLDKFLNPSGL